MTQIVTASATRDGQPLYRQADGSWTPELARATVLENESDASAHRVALSIANSPLVKTAIAGEDANWGRVVMAVGKAGEPAERFSEYLLLEGGELAAREPTYRGQGLCFL